ncbi:hypothetical protein Q31b_41740 [Novipirellula aureliae]|uniref:Uncharacterized protein n=1 Tax=Novipirellula aureliae TaxID=2527966 RepID=A0A5C6DR23_9BACT|nr:hypothetical protein Q31b_41740 [Novipirellula aureliae]
MNNGNLSVTRQYCFPPVQAIESKERDGRSHIAIVLRTLLNPEPEPNSSPIFIIRDDECRLVFLKSHTVLGTLIDSNHHESSRLVQHLICDN